MIEDNKIKSKEQHFSKAKDQTLTNLLEWLIIHDNPWHKSMRWIKLSSFRSMFLFNLVIKINMDLANETMKRARR